MGKVVFIGFLMFFCLAEGLDCYLKADIPPRFSIVKFIAALVNFGFASLAASVWGTEILKLISF